MTSPPPTTYAEADEFLGVLLDAVAAADRELAVVAARRARLIDQVRRWSRSSVDALAEARGEPHGSSEDHRIAARSMTAELACGLRVPEGTATALLEEARALVHDLPATMAALSEGDLSYRHAQVIMTATAALPEASTMTVDAMLAERAKTTTVASLGRVARRARERHDPRPLVERHTVALVERRVELEPGQDGMSWLHQLMPAVQAAAIFNRLSDIASACQGPDETRTVAQLRADACVELLLDDDARAAAGAGPVRTSPPPGPCPDATTSSSSSQQAVGDSLPVSMRGVRPVVAVTVPVMTLLGHSDEPGDLAGHGPIDAATARELAAHAPSFIRLLTHPETGTVLSVGRQRYSVPADLRAWLQIRDETCRFPGCSRRAARCDVDHVTDWARGGTTDHSNLIHLCRKHHRLKHTTRWTPQISSSDAADSAGETEARPDSAVRWEAPSGRTYADHAAVELPAAVGRSRPGTLPDVMMVRGAQRHPQDLEGPRDDDRDEPPPF